MREVASVVAVALGLLSAGCSLTSLDDLAGGDDASGATSAGDGGGSGTGATTTASGDGGAPATTVTTSGATTSSATVGPGGGGGGATTSSTQASTSTGVEPQCDPTTFDDDDDDAVEADCGLFVDAAARPGGDGTQRAPLGSLAEAIALAPSGGSVYVCAGDDAHFESIEITRDVELFGQLDCSTWGRADAATAWTSSSIPLEILGADVVVRGFTISAVGAEVPGASTIGVFVRSGGALDIAESTITVAAGKDAEDAMALPPVQPASGGSPGTGGCVSTGQVPGGDGGSNVCGGIDVSGGDGGDGSLSDTGGDGDPGQGQGASLPGGDGQTAAEPCRPGVPGFPGLEGAAGDGASWRGTLSASGFTTSFGAPGMPGAPGRGGSGGGGAKICTNNFTGPGGGGGGAAGCGGVGGAGGPGGGSSIAIAVLDGSLTIAFTDIFTSTGGVGGAGADGQPGQQAGDLGFPGGTNACPGARGGSGGAGGPGGGGAGGHSFGIALVRSSLDVLNGVAFSIEVGGEGGLGGTGVAGAGGNGRIGESDDITDL